jgi:hypothetical protein
MASLDRTKRRLKTIAYDLITTGETLRDALIDDHLSEINAAVGDTIADLMGVDSDLQDAETLLDRVVKARSKR